MSELKYTDEQQAALSTRDVGVALDAGAGCGKTFVLTERYLSHLDPNIAETAELSEVVAITFTDAAAREMRERIRKKCRERFLKADASSAAHWRQLLESLDEARVSTIHSLCTSLIRQYAIELGIDPSFRVLDAPEAVVMRSESLDATLRKKLHLPSGQTDIDLVKAAAELGLNKLKDCLRALGKEDGKPRFVYWAKQSPEKCIAAWKSFYQDKILPIYIEKFLALPAVQTLRELLPMATPKTPLFAERIEEIEQALEAVKDSDNPHQALLDLAPYLKTKRVVGDKNKFVYTDKDWPDPSIKKQFTATLKAMRDLLEKQKHPANLEDSTRAAELGIQIQRLAMAALRDYRDTKRQAGLLDQDDLLVEARRLLTSSDFENEQKRIANGIRILLVDEFQDTDQNQVEIVRALVEANQAKEPVETKTVETKPVDSKTFESKTGESKVVGSNACESESGGLADGRLFFVGDFKQSIYRFRGAEPEVFRNLQKATPLTGRLPLSKNFRSQPAVLDFVNALFGKLFVDEYTDLKPVKPQLTRTPAVEFLWTPLPEPTAGRREALKPEKLQAEAATVAAHLRALIDGSESLVIDSASGEPRPARPGDIALLFRALSDVAIFEVALREAGFDYYLVGGHAFYAQQEVYDLVNILQSIESACDDIALAGALRSPFFGLHDETLYWLTRQGSLNEGLLQTKLPTELSDEQRIRTEHAQKSLKHLRQIKNQLNVAELISALLELTNYDAVLLAEFLGQRKLANLEKLILQAHRTDTSGGDLRSYLRQLNEFIRQPPKEGDAATSSEEANAIRLMTVHGSKGLEFPIVVLPDLNRKSNTSTPAAAYHPELGPLIRPTRDSSDRDKKKAGAVGIDLFDMIDREAEEQEKQRLFYVACTRAADRLILSSTMGDTDQVTGAWLKLLKKRFDLSSGRLIRSETLEEGENDPLVVVTEPPPKLATVQQTKRIDFEKILNKAETSAKRNKPNSIRGIPKSVAPIRIERNEIRIFSVSRLSGKLTQDFTHPTPSTDSFETKEELNELDIDSRKLGTLVHAIIERLDRSASQQALQNSIQKWANSLSPRIIGRHYATAVREATALLNRFITSDAWQLIREAKQLKREVEFLLPWSPDDSTSSDSNGTGSSQNDSMLRGYIDAMLLDSNNQWHILDYKTNLVEADQVSDVAETYRLQLGVYALAVEQAMLVSPGSLKLCFLRPGIVHGFDWNETTRRETIEKVNLAIGSVRDELVAP